MSWNGIGKGIARIPQVLSTKAGYSHQTVDGEYSEMETMFNKIDTSATKLLEEARRYKDSLSASFEYQKGIASTFYQLYSPIIPVSDSNSPTNGEIDPSPPPGYSQEGAPAPEEILKVSQNFKKYMNEVREEITPYLQTIEIQVIVPLTEYIHQLGKIKAWMKKRQNKLIDYDRHKESVAKLKASERDVTLEKKLARAENDFDAATKEYDAVNSVLKEELPHFLNARDGFMTPCFRVFFISQHKIYGILYGTFHELRNTPYFGVAVENIVEDFIPKSTIQAELIGSLDVVNSKKARPISSAAFSQSPTSAGNAADGGISKTSPTNKQPPTPSYVSDFVDPWASKSQQLLSSSSAANTITTTGAFQPTKNTTMEGSKIKYLVALYPFVAQTPGDLTFDKNDRIELVEKTENVDDWWKGRVNGKEGIFPGTYVQEI